MLRILRKDLIIVNRHHITSILVSILVLVLLQMDNADYSFMGLYICLASGYTYTVGQSCLIDDKGVSQSWLKTLPLNVHNIVDSKYMMAILALVESTIIYVGTKLSINYWFSSSMGEVLGFFPAMIGFHLLYCALYLFLYFKYRYSVAQYSYMLMIVFLLFAKMVGSKKYFNLFSIPGLNIFNSLIYIGIVCFLISWLYSRLRYSKK